MAIKGYNFAPSMFLLELSTQCNFAKECDRWLRRAAPGWYSHATEQQVMEQMAPMTIMIYCTAFLSAAGVISKSLFPRRKKVIHRCKRLRELLEIKDAELPILRDLAVRNAFEHVDERLDTILPSLTRGSFAPVSVSEASKATIVLKRFDPRHLTISFANTPNLSLVDCMAEISRVESQINPAFKKLADREFRLWP